VFSPACGLYCFVSVLRDAGIALLLQPAVELGAEARLDLGGGRVGGEIIELVGVFGRVVQLLGRAVSVAFDKVVRIRIVPGVPYPGCPVRVVQLALSRPAHEVLFDVDFVGREVADA